MNGDTLGQIAPHEFRTAWHARLLSCSILSAALMGGWSATALAQNLSPDRATVEPQDLAAVGVEDIVVTAQKREQNVQDVPVAVTAITQASLQVNRVLNVNDLTGLVPGLLSRQSAGSLGSPNFSMRGVLTNAAAASQDRQISIYLDGVYIGGTRGVTFDLPDIERIEVLRGPQGTLFGRNATAGAISVTTRDPSGEFGGRQEITIGNYAQVRSRTTIDTPQLGPFSAYLTYVHDERRGDVRNLGAGTAFDRTSPFTDIGVTKSPKYLGSRNSEAFNAALKFAPSDSFQMVYKFDRSRAINSPEARVAHVINPNDLTGNLLQQLLAAQPAGGGRFGPVFLDPENKRPAATNNAWTQQGFIRYKGHRLITTLYVTNPITIKNVSAYRSGSAYGPVTLAGISGLEFTPAAVTPYATFVARSTIPGFATLPESAQNAAVGQIASGLMPLVGSYFGVYEGNSYGRNHQYSTETQVNYESSLMSLTAGGLYFRSSEKIGGLPGMRSNFAIAPVPYLLPLGRLNDSTSKTKSIAAYAQAELHVIPELDIVVGGRVTKDKKTGNTRTGGTFVGTRTDGTVVGFQDFPFSFKKTKPTFSIGANYKPNDDLMIYGKYSTAFLSGGAIGQISFQPETVKSAEIGVKSEIFDRRLRINVALFDAVYNHSQSAQSGSVVILNGVPQTALGTVVIDNGTLKSRGFEMEATAAPIEGVTFGGSVGYASHKLTNPNPLVTGGQPFELVGVPNWVGALYGQYRSPPVLGNANLFIRLDANYQGKFRAIPQPNIGNLIPSFAPYEFTPARWIMNGRVALQRIEIGSLATGELAVWARNLTNNKDPLYTLKFGNFELNSSYQPARTIGADFTINF